jgi:hypothetical protein
VEIHDIRASTLQSKGNIALINNESNKMIAVISDKKQITKLHKSFQIVIDKYFDEEINCWVGFPSGNFQDDVRYSADLNLWISVKEIENRYWNGFGIGRPIEGTNNSLVGEINFPYKDLNRRIAGVFAQEENGNILVLHRGKIGGGRKGVGKKLFTDNFRGGFVKAIDGDRETEFCLVGELHSNLFPKQIAIFINEIYRIKNLEPSSDFSDLADFSYTDEHFGTSITEKNDPVILERTHGIVVNALASELKGRGLKIGNDRNRDLFIHKRGQIKTLFEIKTSSSTQCLYSAVGQLLLYSIPIKNEIKLIAVLPEKLSKSVTNKFKALGIELLYYDWENDTPKFTKLYDLI